MRIMDDLHRAIEQISVLSDTAYSQYSAAVELVLSDQITEPRDVSRILDGLCDFCGEERFAALYRSVCKHIFCRYPELVVDYIRIYRSMWMAEDSAD